MEFVYTTNTKAASALSALGFSPRDPQPIEKINGTFYFYFDREPLKGLAKKESLKADQCLVAWDKAWSEYILGEDHPLYYMKACLDNRDSFIHWMKHDVVPLISKQFGDKTLLLPVNASQKTKEWVRKMI